MYYETDMVDEIYFLTSGTAGFTLPLKSNIVYIEINEGDYFGEIDLLIECSEKQVSIEYLMENFFIQINRLKRGFTVQAIQDSTLLSLSM